MLSIHERKNETKVSVESAIELSFPKRKNDALRPEQPIQERNPKEF